MKTYLEKVAEWLRGDWVQGEGVRAIQFTGMSSRLSSAIGFIEFTEWVRAIWEGERVREIRGVKAIEGEGVRR